MKALIFQNKVIQVEDAPFEVAPALSWIDCPDECVPEWTYIDSVLAAPIIEQPTIQQTLDEYNLGIQVYLNEVAKQKGYENSLYCISYLNSAIPSWKLQAETFMAWRDSVWVYVLAQLPKFLDGDRPLVPLQEFIAEFPIIEWTN